MVRGLLAGRQTGDMAGMAVSIALERLVGFVALLFLIAVGQPVLLARLNDPSLTRLAIATVLPGLCAWWPCSDLRSSSAASAHGRCMRDAALLFRCAPARRISVGDMFWANARSHSECTASIWF